MKYLSITQTAERWGISTRRIQILCGEGRVPGAIRIGTVWGIPEDAEKPADARIKSGKANKSKGFLKSSGSIFNSKMKNESQILSATLTRNNGVYSTSRVRMGALTPWLRLYPNRRFDKQRQNPFVCFFWKKERCYGI